MGGNVSREQMNEYREVAKDRLSDEAIAFLYTRFHKAAPDGCMTPLLFKHYIQSTDVFKDAKIRAAQRKRLEPTLWDRVSSQRYAKEVESLAERDEAAAAERDDDTDYYRHLFRGYDLDNDGTITFKKFLMYHIAIVYSTEELLYVVFNTFDEDGDGFLSLADLKSVMVASTRYVGDYDVRDREVRRVIDEEARRLMGFLDIRKQGRVELEDMHLITQKYPQVLQKMKSLM